jgi:hypothetical protein
MLQVQGCVCVCHRISTHVKANPVTAFWPFDKVVQAVEEDMEVKLTAPALTSCTGQHNLRVHMYDSKYIHTFTYLYANKPNAPPFSGACTTVARILTPRVTSLTITGG